MPQIAESEKVQTQKRTENHIRKYCDGKGTTLPDKSDPTKCSDDTEQIVINIPCRLIERAQKYADENGNTVTGVVIEALDALLGGRTTK